MPQEGQLLTVGIIIRDGFQKAYYGREVENPSVLQLFVGMSRHKAGSRSPTLIPQLSDWDSYEAHQTFTKSSIYGPFAKHFMTIVDGKLSMYHANFDPHPPSAALSTDSPVTEVLTAYLTSKDESREGNLRKFVEVLKGLEGFKAASGGWVIEDVEHERIGPGKKGKAFVGVLGWESVEAHMKARETDAFKENIHLLREGPVAMEVHHTKFNEK